MNDVKSTIVSKGAAALKMDTSNESTKAQDAAFVKDFLLANPDFFHRYPLLAEQLDIPHAQRGTVSLVELQAEQLREKVKELQIQISQLMTVAKQNEEIYRIYADLNLKLFQCEDVLSMVTALEESVQKELSLSAVTLRTFKGAHALNEMDATLFKQKRFKDNRFFFGRMTQHENQVLFGDKEVSSVALMLLGEEGELGILCIGSEAPDHFRPDMDTLLITQLQQVVTLLLYKLQS